jgi:hypothetical protein
MQWVAQSKVTPVAFERGPFIDCMVHDANNIISSAVGIYAPLKSANAPCRFYCTIVSIISHHQR